MSQGKSFWSFAADVDVHFDTLSEWTMQHPEFSEAKKIGMSKLLKFDEELNLMGSSGQLKRLARTEKVTNDDGTVKENQFYDQATFAQTYRIFLMKNRYPKMYRDKIEVESSSSSDAQKTSKILQEIMNDPQLAEAAKIIAEKLSEE